MRRLLSLALAAALLLQGCSLGPVLPGGCDQYGMSESRKKVCESGLAPRWAMPQAAAESEPQCRRTIGGVECYAPAR